MRKLILLFLLIGTAYSQSTKVRSVTSLPLTCDPGGGTGGRMADHVDLWNGSINVPYACTALNTWNAIGGAWVAAGTSAAPGLPAPGTTSLGFYAGTVTNTWTVTTTSSAGGTATVTVTSADGFPFSFRVNDYIVTNAIGGGYDCVLATPCQITAVNSGASTISYLSAGTGNQTSGSVNAYTIGIAAQKMIFNSLQSSTSKAANSGSIQLAAQDTIKAHDVTNNVDVILLKKNGDPSVADTRAAQCGDPTYGCTTASGSPLTSGGVLKVKGPWTLSSPQPSANANSALNFSLFTLAMDGFWYMTGNGLGTADPQGEVVFASQPGAGAGPSPGTANQIPVFDATGVSHFRTFPSTPCAALTYTPTANGGPGFGCIGGATSILSVGGLYPTMHDAIAACQTAGCIVIDTVTENLTNNTAGNPSQPFCSGTWSATNPYTCTAGSWKQATVYMGAGKWTSDYNILYGSSYEHLLGVGVSVGGAGATTGTLISATSSWDQTGPDPGHPMVRLSPLFTGSNYQFNNTIKDLTLDCSAASAAGKVCGGIVNDGADENSIADNIRVIAVKPPTATPATTSLTRAGCPSACVVTVADAAITGCTTGCVLQNGQQVIIAGTTSAGDSFNGTFTVKSATGSPTTSFTYDQPVVTTNEVATGQGTIKIAGAFMEWLGNGAQNSEIRNPYFLSGTVGYQDANTNGILVSSYSLRGIFGGTFVMGNGTGPNSAILVTGSGVQPRIQSPHCEGWKHCVQWTDKAGGSIDNVSVGNTSAGDVLNFDSTTTFVDATNINMNASGTLVMLTDNTFTVPFSPATSVTHMGYYWLGVTGGGLHTYKSDLKSFADIDYAQSYIEQTAPTIQAVPGTTQDPVYASSVDHRIHIQNSSDTLDRPATITVGTGTSTSNGTAIGAGTSQAQPGITVTGATVTDVAACSLNASPVATWQTGIQILAAVVTANTVTPWLSNPTAGSITPAATAIRCTVTR